LRQLSGLALHAIRNTQYAIHAPNSNAILNSQALHVTPVIAFCFFLTTSCT
jgi:hypothetical protein